jgi:ABC-type uncharacterized transport system ATPase subunit
MKLDQQCLSLTGVTKQFPGCLANDHVDLDVGRNEIHALLGENGAGKSHAARPCRRPLHPAREKRERAR